MGLLPNRYLTGNRRLEPSIIDKRNFIVDVILPVVDVIVLSIRASHKGTVYDLWVWGITEEIIPCAGRREIGTSADKENEDESQYESRSEDENMALTLNMTLFWWHDMLYFRLGTDA